MLSYVSNNHIKCLLFEQCQILDTGPRKTPLLFYWVESHWTMYLFENNGLKLKRLMPRWKSLSQHKLTHAKRNVYLVAHWREHHQHDWFVNSGNVLSMQGQDMSGLDLPDVTSLPLPAHHCWWCNRHALRRWTQDASYLGQHIRVIRNSSFPMPRRNKA